MKKKDILDPKTFNHFIDCKHCGYSFDPEFFDKHNCDDMKKPAHNHIGGDCLADCPFLLAKN